MSWCPQNEKFVPREAKFNRRAYGHPGRRNEGIVKLKDLIAELQAILDEHPGIDVVHSDWNYKDRIPEVHVTTYTDEYTVVEIYGKL